MYNVNSKDILSKWLDKNIHPVIQFGNKMLSSFQVFGYVGISLSFVLVMTLAFLSGMSTFVMAGILIVSVATFFILAMLTKIITGEEKLIYYHHEIAIIIVDAIVLWLFDQPVLPYLDITILGIGVFLIFGRMGCLMVGCCHGRPHHFGVCYGEDHAHAGFTNHYVGVRLFPVQALESLWVFCIVVSGIYMILNHESAGVVFAWYIIAYDIGRFSFEFLRGDPARAYWKGFSEGQWTSLLLMLVVVLLEMSGLIPYKPWHLLATVTILLTMIVVSIVRHNKKYSKYLLLNPHYVQEISRLIHSSQITQDGVADHGKESLSSQPVIVQETSTGIRISTSSHLDDDIPVHHVALSSRDGDLTREVAQTVADIIHSIQWPHCILSVVEGEEGIYHLLYKEVNSENDVSKYNEIKEKGSCSDGGYSEIEA